MTGYESKKAMAADKYAPSDPFERWWYYEGSAPPYTHHDLEEHTKRMCKIAWNNGANGVVQPAQKPVAWWVTSPNGELDWGDEPIRYKEQRPLEELFDGCGYAPLYTTPPQRPWVGLTDAEKSELWEISRAALPRYAIYASLIEARLKDKNNG